MIPWKALVALVLCFLWVGPGLAVAQLSQDSSRSGDALLQQAVAATEAGDLDRALELYRSLESSPSSWYAWAGKSGQVAIHRMTGDGGSARAVTARIVLERPELAGLAAVWDGDTALLEGDLDGAIALYQVAVDLHGDDWVDEKPMGAVALRQISRARLEAGDPGGAAEAERQLLNRYPRFTDRRFSLASILAFEAMESGELPLKPVERLLRDGDCSPSRPCALSSDGRVSEQIPRGALRLRGVQGIYLSPDAGNIEALGGARESAPTSDVVTSNATACTTPTATDGFKMPMYSDSSAGYKFMETPDCCGGYHTGDDLNRGGYQEDCNDPIYSTAKGCVRDVMSSQFDWGSAAIEHFYTPGFWTSQYGHAYEVFYSVGAAVAKGAQIGKVGGTGSGGPNDFACHLHFEMREQDHTARNNASSYPNTPLNLVGDQYQDPVPFIAAHPAYQEVRWVDEESLTFTGTWQTQTGIGDKDDLKWADTATKSNYARYYWTPTTSGTYRFYAFIPWNHRPASTAEGLKSTSVRYKVVNRSTGVTLTSSLHNQSLYKDAWRRIGAAVLAAGTPYYLEVANNYAQSGKKMVVDDFLIIRVGQGGSCNSDVTDPGHWKGEYFNNTSLSGSPVMVRDDGTGPLNFDWGSGSPGSSCGVPADNFSARWTRTAYFNAGTYQFSVTSDDGFRLYVDGVLQMQAWHDQGPTTYTKNVALSAGNHVIKMEYYEHGGGAVAKLNWKLVSNCFANVPSGSWKGEYFNNKTLSGSPAMIRNDGTSLNFDWGSGSPSPACGFPAENFSVRWTRTVYLGAGTYRFDITSDDGFRLYVDGTLKLNKWFDQGATAYSVNVPLSAGNHVIKLEYYENVGSAVAKLSWKTAPAVAGAVLRQVFWRGGVGYSRTVPFVSGTSSPDWARASGWSSQSASSLPGWGTVQSWDTYAQQSGFLEAFWRGNQGYYRLVPWASNGHPNYAAAPGWSGPLSLSGLPGVGSIQAQDSFQVGGFMLQSFWRGDQGWYRSVPVDPGGNPIWHQARPWNGPLGLNGLPGQGSIQTLTAEVYAGKRDLLQSLWRSNQGYWRRVPIDAEGNILWSQARPWSAPIPISGLPGSGNIEAQADSVYYVK
jgi:murein DD-endopeptidase MepM/ murein hydrolase activator NlpD